MQANFLGGQFKTAKVEVLNGLPTFSTVRTSSPNYIHGESGLVTGVPLIKKSEETFFSRCGPYYDKYPKYWLPKDIYSWLEPLRKYAKAYLCLDANVPIQYIMKNVLALRDVNCTEDLVGKLRSLKETVVKLGC